MVQKGNHSSFIASKRFVKRSNFLEVKDSNNIILNGFNYSKHSVNQKNGNTYYTCVHRKCKGKVTMIEGRCKETGVHSCVIEKLSNPVFDTSSMSSNLIKEKAMSNPAASARTLANEVFQAIEREMSGIYII
jgi:hypothetical protein